MLAVFALCLVHASADGQPQQQGAAAEWVQFESADKSFAAQFPQTPVEEIKRVPLSGGTYTQRIYAASDAQSTRYSVIVQDLPAGNNSDAARHSSLPMMDELANTLGKEIGEQLNAPFKLERLRDFTLGGYSGRQYNVSVAGKTGVLSIHLVEQRAIALLALGGVESDARIERFLDSFRLRVIQDATTQSDNQTTATQSATPSPSSTPDPSASPTPARPQAVLFDTLKARPSGKQTTGATPGTGQGTGTSTGEGAGTGRNGEGRNTGSGEEASNTEGIFRAGDVTSKAAVTTKPQPGYTEEARQNSVDGTVRLRVILAASGKITNITVIKGLPDGLTEKAIAAAREIKFRPAQKDGHAVSQYITLEYNFNIYYDEDKVTDKAVILDKPAPDYTEDARRNKVTGTVVLNVMLLKDGAISSVDVVKGLPDGLTEKAIEAARKIKFKPAADKGKPVSVARQIEYAFTLN